MEPRPLIDPLVGILEHSGRWARSLRPRCLSSARWVESRTSTELLRAISGVCSPVVLIEAGKDGGASLGGLAEVVSRASAPYILFIDPAGRIDVMAAAREMGATMVASGKTPPPIVAGWVSDWIGLSAEAASREGWSRPIPVDPSRDPAAWVESLIAEVSTAGTSGACDGAGG